MVSGAFAYGSPKGEMDTNVPDVMEQFPCVTLALRARCYASSQNKNPKAIVFNILFFAK